MGLSLPAARTVCATLRTGLRRALAAVRDRERLPGYELLSMRDRFALDCAVLGDFLRSAVALRLLAWSGVAILAVSLAAFRLDLSPVNHARLLLLVPVVLLPRAALERQRLLRRRLGRYWPER